MVITIFAFVHTSPHTLVSKLTLVANSVAVVTTPATPATRRDEFGPELVVTSPPVSKLVSLVCSPEPSWTSWEYATVCLRWCVVNIEYLREDQRIWRRFECRDAEYALTFSGTNYEDNRQIACCAQVPAFCPSRLHSERALEGLLDVAYSPLRRRNVNAVGTLNAATCSGIYSPMHMLGAGLAATRRGTTT